MYVASKVCRCCGKNKALNRFRPKERDYASVECYDCTNKRTARLKTRHPELYTRKKMLDNARQRARRNGIPFDLTLEDIPPVPDLCPALGIKILCKSAGKGGTSNSPSFDRIVPELGYIPGNVVIISHKANRIKQDATAAEISAVASWLDKQGKGDDTKPV